MPAIRSEFSPDFVIGNSENLTGGKGPTSAHVDDLRKLGFDCLTGGNHVFSHVDDLRSEFDRSDCIQIRPANYYEVPGYPVPGKGYRILEKNGARILVFNLLSGVFLKDQVYNPFLRADEILAEFPESSFDAVFVDFHRETTSEIYCLAEYLTGRATFVYGTHTHVQTNDEHVHESGTGMIADVGMTGPLRSAIGQKFEGRVVPLVTGTNLFSKKPESETSGPGVLNAVFVEVEDRKCVRLEKIRIRE